MRNAKYILLAAGLLVVLSVFAVGCGRKSMATVNGEAISKDDFYTKLERLQIPTQAGNKPAGALVLDQLINEKLIAQIAKDKNAVPTEAQINEKLAMMKKDNPAALKAMEQSGISQDEIKQQIWVQQAYANVISKGEKATEKEAKQYYDQVRDMVYKKPEQVNIAIIATKTKKSIDEASKLLKDGQEFSTVAMRLSEDPVSKQNGGTLGPVAQNQPNVPKKIIETAFNSKKGEVSAPFQISGDKTNMWYILKALDRSPAVTKSFNDVKSSIMENIRVSKGSQKVDFAKILAEKRKKAKIDISDKKYQSLSKVAGDTGDKK